MLRQVTALAGRYDIPVQALVEESMACGIGVCMTCVLPGRRRRRDHPDGPVLRGRARCSAVSTVRWDDMGTIPFDALGAPGWKPARSRRAARASQRAAGSGRRSPRAGARPMPADLRTRLGHVELP